MLVPSHPHHLARLSDALISAPRHSLQTMDAQPQYTSSISYALHHSNAASSLEIPGCSMHARNDMQQQCTSTPWSEKASSMAMPPLPTIAMRLAWRMHCARLSTVSLSLSTSTCLPSAIACTEHTFALLLLKTCMQGAACSTRMDWDVEHLTFGRAPVQMQSLSYGCSLPSCRDTTLVGISIRLATPMTIVRLGCCRLARSFSVTAPFATHVSHAHPVIACSLEHFRRSIITFKAFDTICDLYNIRDAL